MKKLPFILLGLAVVVFVSVAVVYGIRPKAHPVIRPSNFNDYIEVGETLYKQLYPHLNPYDVVAFGISPKEGSEIIASVIRKSRVVGDKPFQAIVQVGNEPLTSVPEGVEVIRVSQDGRLAVEKIKKLKAQNKRTLLLAGAWDVPHFHFENLIHFIEDALGEKVVSFAKTDFHFDMQDARELQTECAQNNKENSQFGHLSCLGYKKSRWMRKDEKVTRDRKVVILERQGERDYVLYLYRPKM